VTGDRESLSPAVATEDSVRQATFDGGKPTSPPAERPTQWSAGHDSTLALHTHPTQRDPSTETGDHSGQAQHKGEIK